MDFEEFQVYFWSYISASTVSNADRIENNTDFCEAVCFDSYRVYDQSGIHIDIICKLAENTLFNVRRFKPILGS